MHGEPFTLVARRDSGIRSLADLEGRRINLGTLDRSRMVKEGLAAPLHEGAARYYRQNGLIP